jgi:hypothetical protein
MIISENLVSKLSDKMAANIRQASQTEKNIKITILLESAHWNFCVNSVSLTLR